MAWYLSNLGREDRAAGRGQRGGTRTKDNSPDGVTVSVYGPACLTKAGKIKLKCSAISNGPPEIELFIVVTTVDDLGTPTGGAPSTSEETTRSRNRLYPAWLPYRGLAAAAALLWRGPGRGGGGGVQYRLRYGTVLRPCRAYPICAAHQRRGHRRTRLDKTRTRPFTQVHHRTITVRMTKHIRKD